MNTIQINGLTIKSAKSISVVNGKIMIDGREVDLEKIGLGNEKNIKIEIAGNVENLEIDDCNSIEIKGNVGAVETISGIINITGDVSGAVSAISGNIFCKTIRGKVSTVSGSVSSVSTKGTGWTR